jgi:hypothetical protein
VSLKLRERDKLKSILQKNQDDLTNKTAKLGELNIIMGKEGNDLKKLESLSLTGLFHSILGSKEEQLEKERQEFLAAKLKYDEAEKAIKGLEAEISKTVENLTAYEGLDVQYERIMKEKENYILECEDENSSKLMDLVEKLAELKSDIKELEEAVFAGNLVKEKLQHMIASLKSAGNWGTWDMLGGGFLATAVKHSKIDEARAYASSVQQHLQGFRHELEDVNTYVDLSVNIGSFETFADYFFDGLISDWIVQSRINDTLNNALRMEENVDNIIAELHRKLDEVKKKSISVEKERSYLVKEI